MKTKDELLHQLVAIAQAEVGVKEEGGNNRGPRIREYQAATWLEPGPWPWCAAFVCWAMQEWLKDESVRTALDISDVSRWRPKTAGAFDMIRWAKSKNLLVLGEICKAQKGDLVIFDFSHIGIVRENQSDKMILTIEGNTGSKGLRDSEEIDGVWAKERHFSLTYKYIRLL